MAAILLKGNLAAILDLGHMQKLFVLIAYKISFPKMYSFQYFPKKSRWDINENKPLSWRPFCKMQYGSHTGLGANGNIVFSIAYTIGFRKMYSFHTLHKTPAKIHSEPDYIGAGRASVMVDYMFYNVFSKELKL